MFFKQSNLKIGHFNIGLVEFQIQTNKSLKLRIGDSMIPLVALSQDKVPTSNPTYQYATFFSPQS